MAQNITNIVNILVLTDEKRIYENGEFIPVFQKPLRALVCRRDVSAEVIRVFGYILTLVDSHNLVHFRVSDMVADLGLSKSMVYKAIHTLEEMNIICLVNNSVEKRVSISGDFVARNKMINPRMAYRGNTKHLSLRDVPLLLAPKNNADAQKPLLPYDIITDDDFA